MINPYFILVGVLAQFLGGLSYLIDTVKGKIQPNKVTWFMWMLAPMIAFTAEIKQGVGIASLATFIAGFTPLLVFTGSFINKKSEWKLNRFDLICGLLSILGLILWIITKVGNIAILFAILSDGLAALPTAIKSYYYPKSESDTAYWGQSINGGIALLIIPKWDFQHYSFPLYLLLMGIVVIILIRFNVRKILSRKK